MDGLKSFLNIKRAPQRSTHQLRLLKTKSGVASKSISRVLSWMIIYLGHLLPGASSDLTREKQRATAKIPLFGLAPGGVYLADRSPGRWCALTAPFHPYPALNLVFDRQWWQDYCAGNR